MSLHISSLVHVQGWTCTNVPPLQHTDDPQILLSFFGLFWSAQTVPDGPMIQRWWYEFTCSYLWKGMLIGWTWRLKHRRNGGRDPRDGATFSQCGTLVLVLPHHPAI